MRLNYLAAVVLSTMCFFFVTSSPAGLFLSLDPDPASLQNLQVGDTITIRVKLGGIDTINFGTTLDALTATVEWDGSLLGTPIMTAGDIIPDLNDVDLGSSYGEANFEYDVLFSSFGPGISDDGLLFSFDVTAAAPSLTAKYITFTVTSLTPFAFGSDGETYNIGLDPDQPDGLGYTILMSPPSAIPEPSSAVLFGVMGLTVAGWSRFRRRSAQRQGH